MKTTLGKKKCDKLDRMPLFSLFYNIECYTVLVLWRETLGICLADDHPSI